VALTDAVRAHPLLDEAGVDPRSRPRLDAFACDLAAWFVGGPLEDAGAPLRVLVGLTGDKLAGPRAMCRGRPLLAVEAAAAAAVALWPWINETFPDDPPPPPEAAPGRGSEGGSTEGDGGATGSGGDGDPGDGDPGDGDPQDGDGAGGDPPSAPPVDRAVDAAEARAVGAARATRLIEGLVPGFGQGVAPGALERVMTQDLARVARLLAAERELVQLIDRIGRIEAEDARLGTGVGGGEEVVGVQLGGSLARALPSDLGLLGDDETEWLALQRLVEHRLLELSLAGGGIEGVSAPGRRGPVVVCLDTSGSMQGAPEHHARALVLALARRVVGQGRGVYVLAFGAVGETRGWHLRPGVVGVDDLLDFLAWAFHGGTDLEGPLERALAIADEDLRGADVLVVTDGYVRLSAEVKRAVAERAAQRRIRLFTVVIGRTVPTWSHALSAEVWAIEPESGVGLAAAVRRVASPRD
jgi:hypothetical protein